MSRSRIFFILCAAFIVGIGLHSLVSFEQRILEPFTFYVVFLFLLAISLLIRTNYWVFLCLAFAFLGFFRHAQVIPVVDEDHILYYQNQEITLQGVVDSFPRKREKTTAYVIKLKGLEGKLLLTAEHFPAYQYGDFVSITCIPESLNKYEQYSRREGVSAACVFPSHTALVAQGQGPRVKTMLFTVRREFHQRLELLFPNPYGGLLAGLLYGDISGFSKNLKEDFRITGISHITALSGYNVTILAKILIISLVFFWLTRKQALIISFFLILCFVILTGAESSVVRAAIMGFLILGAKGIGRISKVYVALTLAGAIMLAVNPYLLRFDLGFQLSFLATIALIWFSDDLARHTWIRRLPKFLGVREAGAASAAAILFTAPLLFYTTGMLGPLSLVVNILVVPLVPFTMAMGFIAMAADFLFHPLGLVISWLACVPLGWIIAVAEYFARFGAWYWKMNIGTAAVIFGIIVLWIWLWKKRISYVQTNT